MYIFIYLFIYIYNVVKGDDAQNIAPIIAKQKFDLWRSLTFGPNFITFVHACRVSFRKLQVYHINNHLLSLSQNGLTLFLKPPTNSSLLPLLNNSTLLSFFL